jgi:short-subunit dehydrogenase
MKKIALVTGASAGIGKETAKYLAGKGYIVYGAARRLDRMADIRSGGVKTLAMDVTDEASMVTGVAEIVRAEGRIDVLINNAGFGSLGAIEDLSMQDARYQMEVNVFGAARLIQLVLPHMRKQQYGKIVNISSIGGKIAFPLSGWYHASKFALEALSDSLRSEVKQFSIDVIVIEPGGIKSEWAGISEANAKKVSGTGVYKPMLDKFAVMSADLSANLPGPEMISSIIFKAVESKSPETRYHGGHMAGQILFLRKVLSDKMMDRMINSRLK